MKARKREYIDTPPIGVTKPSKARRFELAEVFSGTSSFFVPPNRYPIGCKHSRSHSIMGSRTLKRVSLPGLLTQVIMPL